MNHYRSVHFPIAFLLLGAVIEIAAILFKKDKWHTISITLLMFGTMGAVASVGTGLWMESDHNHPSLSTHKWLGISCLITSILAVISHVLHNKSKWFRHLRTLCFLSAAGLVGVTGHYGGTMAHGEGSDKPSDAAKDAASQGIIMIRPPTGPPPKRRNN